MKARASFRFQWIMIPRTDAEIARHQALPGLSASWKPKADPVLVGGLRANRLR